MSARNFKRDIIAELRAIGELCESTHELDVVKRAIKYVTETRADEYYDGTMRVSEAADMALEIVRYVPQRQFA